MAKQVVYSDAPHHQCSLGDPEVGEDYIVSFFSPLETEKNPNFNQRKILLIGGKRIFGEMGTNLTD